MSRPSGRHSRFEAGIPAMLHYRGRDYSCEAHDLSRSGVLLRGPFPWPADEKVHFSLRSLEGDLALELVGLRARVEEDPERNGTLMALQFADLTEEQESTFERLFSRVIEKKTVAGGLDALRPGAPPHEIRKALEAIPVGQRIALATRAGPREREHLRHDTHPAVLEALARNPNIAIAEIRELAGSRHLEPKLIEFLCADSRFRSDGEIAIRLATHPRVPVSLAERLIAAMNVAQLRRVLTRPTLKPQFRIGIRKRIGAGR